MIQANELRIGNFVKRVYQKKYHSDFYTVKRSYFANNYIDRFEPIQITEKWLLKFGFEKLPYCFSFGRIHITKQDNSNIWWTAFNANNAHINKIEYIHQLQNLYFAITNEELKLND